MATFNNEASTVLIAIISAREQCDLCHSDGNQNTNKKMCHCYITKKLHNKMCNLLSLLLCLSARDQCPCVYLPRISRCKQYIFYQTLTCFKVCFRNSNFFLTFHVCYNGT